MKIIKKFTLLAAIIGLLFTFQNCSSDQVSEDNFETEQNLSSQKNKNNFDKNTIQKIEKILDSNKNTIKNIENQNENQARGGRVLNEYLVTYPVGTTFAEADSFRLPFFNDPQEQIFLFNDDESQIIEQWFVYDDLSNDLSMRPTNCVNCVKFTELGDDIAAPFYNELPSPNVRN